MNTKFLWAIVFLFSGLSAMDNDDNSQEENKKPKVPRIAKTLEGLSRSNSMPSARSMPSSPRLQRFISEQAMGYDLVERRGEGSPTTQAYKKAKALVALSQQQKMQPNESDLSEQIALLAIELEKLLRKPQNIPKKKRRESLSSSGMRRLLQYSPNNSPRMKPTYCSNDESSSTPSSSSSSSTSNEGSDGHGSVDNSQVENNTD